MAYESLVIEWEKLLGSRGVRTPRIKEIQRKKGDEVTKALEERKNEKKPRRKDDFGLEIL